MSRNPYSTDWARIISVREEAGGNRPIKTFRVEFEDPEIRERWSQTPGQCAMVNVVGVGESFISITSPPSLKGFLELSIMRVGNVTAAIHGLMEGDRIAIRGPYGNGFPMDVFKGHDLIFIGAGIGIAPIRSVYMEVLEGPNRGDYGKVTIIYGARTPSDLAFKEEFERLQARDDVEVYLCIDWKFGPEGPIKEAAADGWPAIDFDAPDRTCLVDETTCFTAFVPQLVEVIRPSPENAFALTCGPPIAIKFIAQNLEKLGWSADRIYTTLENRMKCGIGKCGRCNIGHVYVCKDGPVFTYAEVKSMPSEY